MYNPKPYDFLALLTDEFFNDLQELSKLVEEEDCSEEEKEDTSIAEGQLKTIRAPDFSVDQNPVRYVSPPPSAYCDNFDGINSQYFEHLPTFWGAINEVALNTKAPVKMVLCNALAAAATVVQRLFDVKSPIGSTHPTSLNIIVIALSGERKTSVDKQLTKVFSRFLEIANKHIRNKNQNFETDMIKWVLDNKYLEKAYIKAKKEGSVGSEEIEFEEHQSAKPRKLDYLSFIYDDFSMPALLQGLYSNMPVASIMTSEGAKVLDDANMKNVPFMNKLWDADDVQVSRISRDSFWLHDVRLTTSVMIQPGVMKKILDKRHEELRSSGYFARALVCNPETRIGNRPIRCTKVYSEKLDVFHSRLMGLIIQMLKSFIDKDFSRTAIELDQQAEDEWLRFANETESSMAPGGRYQAATDHGSKLAENVLRVAGVLHALEFGEGKVSFKTLVAAIHICVHCSKDFVDTFVPLPQEVQDGQRLYKYLNDNFGIYLQNKPIEQTFFNERFVRRNRVRQCGPLKNAERLNQAISHLARQGVIRLVEEVKPQGRGIMYIDLLPSSNITYISNNGFPLRPVLI